MHPVPLLIITALASVDSYLPAFKPSTTFMTSSSSAHSLFTRVPFATPTALSATSGYENHGGYDDAFDVQQIEDLLIERSLYREERNYEDADDVRNELNSLGVTVFDSEKLWCMNGKEPRELKYTAGAYKGVTQRTNSRDFGELGHDYEHSNDDSRTYTEEELADINDKIRERLECKLRRDFDSADEIKAELVSMSIDLHDGQKQWRGDGIDFIRYRKVGSFLVEKEDEIIALIKERSAAKKTRDFDTADAIKARLDADYNVVVDDRSMTWKVASQTNSKWLVAEDSDPINDSDADSMRQILRQRETAKAKRDYKTADLLQQQLNDDFNIFINDSKRTFGTKIWSYARTCAKQSDEDDSLEGEILEVVIKRAEAKYARRYSVADDLREELREKYGVEVDDRTREWGIGQRARA